MQNDIDIMESKICQRLFDSIEVKKNIIENKTLIEQIKRAAEMVADCLKKGGKLILGGNGGSESDSLHFAGEITGRFQKERQPWPAVVLGADQAILTAIANDYGYEEAYARQAKALVKKEDLLIVISTSGNSKNLLQAVCAVRETGCRTMALLGKSGGELAGIVNYPIIVPSEVTARIQESHITIIHIICELVEEIIS